MVERVLVVLAAAAALAASGCESCDCNGGGDGDLDSDLDGGEGDADAWQDGDLEPFAFDLRAYAEDGAGERGAPLAGVEVAVETEAGRAELATDAEGRARVEVGPGAETVTLTLAVPGRTVVTIYRADLSDLEYWTELEGEVAVDLPTLQPPEPVRSVQVSVTAEGVAAGMRWCSSAAPFYVTCGGPNDVARFDRPASDGPVRLTGFVVEPASGALVDYAEVELPDAADDLAVTIAFDGVPDLPAVGVEVTLALPDDPESVFRTAGLYLDGPFPVIVMEPGEYLVRGGATAETEVEGGEAFDMRVGWFAGAGEALLPGFALYPAGALDTYSYRWFSSDLEPGTYDFIDIPRVSAPLSGGDLSSTFSWQEVAGADRYGLYLVDETGAVLWKVLADHDTSVELPELPAGYDPTADWPEEGGAGGFAVYAWQEPFAIEDPEEPLRVDRQESLSSLHALSLGR